MLFCGDGLNDLAALGTAEVGMAIGPIDAMAAAPVSTKRSSIAGRPALHCFSTTSHSVSCEAFGAVSSEVCKLGTLAAHSQDDEQ